MTDPRNKGKSQDQRYISRVLTPAERVRLDQFPEKDVLLWALWAGKEAAFKILAKSDPALPFIPRAYEVHLDDYGLRGTSAEAGSCNPHVEGAVLTPEGTIPLRLYRRCTYIHALALSNGEDYFDYVFWRVEVLPEMKGVDSLEVESRIVREALKRCVATHLCWNQKDMEIRRTESGSRPGPPRLYYQGKRTTLDLSLSHDGHFGAYAVLIQKPERDARGPRPSTTECEQEKPAM
ncbi:MAG TPA: 4'-phosphopantetheinyl transferase superfamily protein [Syntrophales bacterium]